MILLATGIEELDRKLSEQLPDTATVYYREAVLNFDFSVVVFSPALPGEMSTENLLFEVRKAGRRVIFLAEQSPERDLLLKLLILGIYDIVFDPVTAEKIVDVLRNPKSFSDVSHLLMGCDVRAHNLKFGDPVRDIETAKKQVEGIARFLGVNYRCVNLNEGLLKIEELLVKEVLYEQGC